MEKEEDLSSTSLEVAEILGDKVRGEIILREAKSAAFDRDWSDSPSCFGGSSEEGEESDDVEYESSTEEDDGKEIAVDISAAGCKENIPDVPVKQFQECGATGYQIAFSVDWNVEQREGVALPKWGSEKNHRTMLFEEFVNIISNKDEVAEAIMKQFMLTYFFCDVETRNCLKFSEFRGGGITFFDVKPPVSPVVDMEKCLISHCNGKGEFPVPFCSEHKEVYLNERIIINVMSLRLETHCENALMVRRWPDFCYQMRMGHSRKRFIVKFRVRDSATGEVTKYRISCI